MFFDKSEDLYAKNSLIYFVMQIRAYNSVQNADVAPSGNGVVKTIDVTLTSSTVDLSLAQYAGGTVFTKPAGVNTGLFSGSLRAVLSENAAGLFELKSPNVYSFDIDYTNIPYQANVSTNATNVGNFNVGAHEIGINIQDGPATAGIAAYTDYYVGFAGLTRNEITAKGSVVAIVGYNGASEKFADNGTL